LFSYGSYRCQVWGLVVLLVRSKAQSGVFFVQPTFFSCSSTFLFFYNVFKFNRTLCGFASFSVRLRTHSSLGGDALHEARHMPGNEKRAETARYRREISRGARLGAAPVKAADNAFTRSCSRDE